MPPAKTNRKRTVVLKRLEINNIFNQLLSNETVWVYSVVVAAFVIRIWNLGAESAWIDEAYSISLAKHAIPEIIKGTAADQHPPLYYIILHIWLKFGSSVSYARILSVIIGLVHIHQTMKFGKSLGGQYAGLGTGVLLAISPIHVWYSQEIRMYILLALLTTLATAELWKNLHAQSNWILYGVFSLLAIYTHYFALFILLAHLCIVIVWNWRHHRPKVLAHWGITTFLLGIAFTPWLPVTINQIKFHSMDWIGTPAFNEIRDVILRLLLGNGVIAIPEGIRWLLAGATGLLLAYSFKWMPEKDTYKAPVKFSSLWFIVPFFVIVGLSFFYPIFQYKQFLIVLVPLLFWVIGLARYLPRAGIIAIMLPIVSLSGASLVQQQFTLTKDDWRDLAQYLADQSKPGDVLYENPAASSLPLSLYWDDNFTMPYYGYPPQYNIVQGGWDGSVLTKNIAEREMVYLQENYTRIWLIEFFPQLWDPDKTLESWLNNHGVMIEEEHFGNIRVRLFVLNQ